MSHTPDPPAPSGAPGLRVFALLLLVAVGLAFAVLARIGLVPPPDGLSMEALVVAGVLIVMAASWIFEGMPLAATALLPMALFPLLGVAAAKTVARSYMSSAIMLLMGGFFLARGLERWGVPQRMAHFVSRRAAGSPRRLLVGLMVTTALLSMWVSNTATTLIMVTVALASVARARSSTKNHPDDVRRFSFALVLGIAYSANVGGITTPVGTAPNVILLGLQRKLMPDVIPVSFLEWMLLTLPIAVVLLPAMAWLLMRVLLPFPTDLDIGAPDEDEAAPLGPGGRRALALFGLTALLWVFRADIDLGAVVIPGIANVLGLGELLDDGAIAMLGVVLMFACPAGESPPLQSSPPLTSAAEEGAVSLAQRLHLLVTRPRVLDWDTASAIPWYLLLLFGGGLALADAFASSGLSAWIGAQLEWLRGAPVPVVVFCLCLGMSLLTEVTSNTATTTLVLPVLFAAAEALGLPPLMLMWPATLCASAAFILPISTPPNAIAAGAVDMKPLEMARVGVWLNLLAVAVITCVTLLLGGRLAG